MAMRDDYANEMDATLKQWSTQLVELQTKMRDAGADQKAKLESVLATLKVQQTAYQEQMKKVREASDAALADMRAGTERMAQEFAKTYSQAAARFAA